MILLGVDIYTADDTHNKRADCIYQHVWAIGGGGGGGGAAADSFATGGAGGGAAFKIITSPASSATITVGAGGSGGAAGSNNGSAGEDSSFDDGTNTVTGGGGGLGRSGNTNGDAGGMGSGGDLNLKGQGGDSKFDSGVLAGGQGGRAAGMFAGGGTLALINSSGDNGGNYGGGGSGASGLNSTARAGGDGGDGVVVVFEYGANQEDESHTINFTQVATGRLGSIRVSQQYVTVVTDRATGEFADADSTIGFTQSSTGFKLTVDASNTITFTQDAESTAKEAAAANTITFTQDTTGSTLETQDAANTVTFTQTADGFVVRTASNTISFTQVAEDIPSGKSTLSFTQVGDWPKAGESTIVFSNVVEPVRDPATQFGFNQFTVTQTAVKLHDATRDDSQTINFQQSATYELDKSAVECLYTPFVGAGADGNPTPPPSTLAGPDEVISQGLQLRFPAGSSPTEIVTLTRSMNIGDIDRLGFDRISRESRGKTLHVFADDQWPKTETILFTVSAVCRDDAVLALDFIEDHIAEEIGLLTHEGRLWRGVIMNPDEAVVEDRTDSFTINIQLEGRHEN